MASAGGHYITYTQDDSWYEPHAIETMLHHLEMNPTVGLVYSDYWDVDEMGKRLRYQMVNTPEWLLKDDVVRYCFLMRRTIYDLIGPQDVKYFPIHDVPWRLKVSKYFPLFPIHVPLMFYTIHSNSLTSFFGPWNLQYMMLDFFLAEGYVDARTYRKRLGEIHIDNAFDAFILHERYWEFLLHAVAGIRCDNAWLRNKGLLKLFVASWLPCRGRYRLRLYTRWKEDVLARQRLLIEQFAPAYVGEPICP
jgi:hypothetical protein